MFGGHSSKLAIFLLFLVGFAFSQDDGGGNRPMRGRGAGMAMRGSPGKGPWVRNKFGKSDTSEDDRERMGEPGDATELFRFLEREREGGFRLKKSVYNDNVRLLFVAGLEGSGHHAVYAMFEVCVNKGKCIVENEMTHEFMYLDHASGVVHGLFGASDVETSITDLQVIYPMFKKLKTVKEGLHFAGLGFTHHSGMLSYPNYNGPNKPMDHPDIHMMALMAEAAGIDYRVLVLQRSAKELIASTERRDIGKDLEPKVLIDNAAALTAQLRLLDPKFYHCVQYQSLGRMDDKAKDELGSFLHPAVKPILESMLEQIEYSAAKPSTPANPSNFTANDYFSFMLDARLSQMNELCNKAEAKL